jgi:tetratricopeptide (TPR) repeat protein
MLPADNPLAAAVRRVGDGAPAAVWEPLIARLAARLAEESGARLGALRPLASPSAGVVGPLPTGAILRRAFALAADPTVESDDDEVLVAEAPEPAGSGEPPCWTPQELWILERLRTANPFAALGRECPFPAGELRGALVGLRGMGIVRPAGRPPAFAHDSGLLKLVELLRARVGASLRERPLGLLDDALQRRLESLARRASAMSHYELLSIAPSADESEIQAAFENVARLVHPSHADRRSVVLSRAELEVLFERAVAAMRTLGDPALRAEYDGTHGISRLPDKSSSDRRVEIVELARREFERARFEERNGDLHSALVLFERAATLAPTAEHWLGLARLQAKNPSWRNRTLESYRRALELDPGAAPEIRFEMGGVLERAGELDEAVSYYQAAAGAASPHAAARDALRRLAADGHGGTGKAGSRLGRLFRRD